MPRTAEDRWLLGTSSTFYVFIIFATRWDEIRRWAATDGAPAWVQAIGSVLAIVAAVAIASRQATESRRALQMSHRAYLSAEEIKHHMLRSDDGKLVGVLAYARVWNRGQTPASDVRISFISGKGPSEDFATFKLPPPIWEAGQGAVIGIGQGCETTRHLLSADELAGVFAGTTAVVFAADIAYADVFGQGHSQRHAWRLEVLLDPAQIDPTSKEDPQWLLWKNASAE